MLIRFIIKNVLSFNEDREFNLLPSRKYTRLAHHKYLVDDIEVLKLSAIYGANGAGKSNLIKALNYLVQLAKKGEIPIELIESKFKLSKESNKNSQVLGIEFFTKKKMFNYAIEIDNGIVKTEELFKLNKNNLKDDLLFERKTDEFGKIQTKFHSKFENDKESATLKSVIEKTLAKPEKPLFTLLNDLDNNYLFEIKEAFSWFKEQIVIILPTTRPTALAHKIDIDDKFRDFANEIMNSFGTGIKRIETEKKTFKEFFGDDENFDKISKELVKDPKSILGLINKTGEEIIAINENNELVIKRLVLKHKGFGKNLIDFHIDNESDGTIRLLDYIPAFQHIISEDKVYIIDEIERSIHPLLIKELINKFSEDSQTKGQLIFTTHECNLLDQEIFRQDEIWFIEKDNMGSSDMYPLSDFKEHHTKDIRKGYMNGRYGAIPFLGNLKDLNWTKYAVTE